MPATLYALLLTKKPSVIEDLRLQKLSVKDFI